MTEVMKSPEKKGEGAEVEPGLKCRLVQIDEAIEAAKAWADANEAEVRMERMMSRNDAWDVRYNELQDFGTAEARKSIERLEEERDAIVTKKEEFNAWCEERYGKKDSE